MSMNPRKKPEDRSVQKRISVKVLLFHSANNAPSLFCIQQEEMLVEFLDNVFTSWKIFSSKILLGYSASPRCSA